MKHYSFDLYYSFLFQTCFIVLVTYLLYFKTPKQVFFFNPIHIYLNIFLPHTILLFFVIYFFFRFNVPKYIYIFRWTPEFFHNRRRDRMEYNVLWQRKRVGHVVFQEAENHVQGLYRTLTKYDEGRLERLEYQLHSEDIIYFRTLVRVNLKNCKKIKILIILLCHCCVTI